MNYSDHVKQMLAQFERSDPQHRAQEFAELLEALGKGIGAALGAIENRKQMNIALEGVLIAIRETAIICHEIGELKPNDKDYTVRVMSAEDYLRDIFKPSKLDG